MSGRAVPRDSAEDRLIARHFRPLALHAGAAALSDDAAAFHPPQGRDLVLTVDALVAGEHFFADDPAETVARKALRVNLSDLAAKGATPAACLLTLALPRGTPEHWLKSFSKGLRADLKHYRLSLLGGDTVRTSGPLMISVTAFGVTPRKAIVRRGGARAGDLIFVSGTVGDAALGLQLRADPKSARRWRLDRAEAKHLADRYLLPQPRTALAAAVQRYATASMDVSDGLAGDLAKLARVSKVAAIVNSALVPLSDAAWAVLPKDPSALETILTGGDDYEILCTVPPGRATAFRRAAKAAGVEVTDIGRIAAGTGTRIIGADGRAMRFQRMSFSHF